MSMFRIFTDFRNEALFSLEIHQVYNSVWFVQSLLMFLWFVKTKRYLPSQKPASSKDVLVKQFDFELLVHSIFYLLEMAFTDILKQYPEMAIHHVFSIIMFTCMYSDKRFYSAITIIPFLLHQLVWIFIQTTLDIYFLFAYNACFMIVGLLLVRMIGKREIESSYVGPTMCVGIVCVNWYIYCSWAVGSTLCLPRGVAGYDNASRGLVAGAGLTSVALAYLSGRYF